MDKQFCDILRGKEIGGSLKMDSRRLSAKNVVPVHISLSSLKRSNLCMGESSP